MKYDGKCSCERRYTHVIKRVQSLAYTQESSHLIQVWSPTHQNYQIEYQCNTFNVNAT